MDYEQMVPVNDPDGYFQMETTSLYSHQSRSLTLDQSNPIYDMPTTATMQQVRY